MNTVPIGIIVGIAITLLSFHIPLQQDTDLAPAPPSATIASTLDELEPQTPMRDTVWPEEIEGSVNNTSDLAVTIGEAMDPSEALFFATSTPMATLDIGEPLDPDDLNQFEAAYANDINVGEAAEPEDPASWMASIAEKAIEAGEPGEPIEAWPPSLNEDQVPIHVGEPLDIDDAFAIPN
jgi:hypothetical protein